MLASNSFLSLFRHGNEFHVSSMKPKTALFFKFNFVGMEGNGIRSNSPYFSCVLKCLYLLFLLKKDLNSIAI